MTPNLRIKLLGEFRLLVDEQPLTSVITRRQQALLAYLLLHRHAPQPRLYVAYSFWPDSAEGQAQTNLRKLFFELRKVLPSADEFIFADSQSLGWRHDAPFTLDVTELEQALDALEEASTPDVAVVQRVVALYQGDLFPACYEEWLLPMRRVLHERVVNTLTQAVTGLETQHEFQVAMGAAEHLLRLDPLHEAAYRQLMHLRMLSGDRAGALRIYHECVTKLEQELEVSPAGETQALYQHLLKLDGETTPVLTPVTGPRHEHVPLVGRKREWHLLQQAWSQMSIRKPHLVTIWGEAGMGKTRLVEELLRWARLRPATVAYARAYAAEGALAYGPLTEWLRSAALRPVLTQLDDIWQTELARLVPELLTTRPGLPPPTPMAEDWQRQRFHEALARAVLAAPSPRLLVLDDLQWSDVETLAWLRYLLRFDAQASLMVVGTVRSEAVDDEHSVRDLLRHLQRDGQSDEIELVPLSLEETAVLAGHHTDEDVTNWRARLYQETEGNPLFIVEMMRVGFVPDNTPEKPPASLPPTVQAVIGARLAQLSSPARTLAHLAATIGRSFSAAILAAASDLDEDRLVQGLDELWRRRLVREHGKEYDFSHDKIREVAYSQLSRERRHLLHRRVAKAMESIQAHELDAVSGQIAAHWQAAGDFERASLFFQRAGTYAAARLASHDAIHYFSRALNNLPELAQTRRYEVLLARYKLLNWQGRREEERADLTVLEELVKSFPDTLEAARQRAEVALCAARYWFGVEDRRQTKIAAQEAVELAEKCQAVGLAAQAYWHWGATEFWDKANYAYAQPLLEKALQLARLAGLQRTEAEALNYLAMYQLYTGGQIQLIETLFREALVIYQSCGDRPGEAFMLGMLAYMILTQAEGRYDEAIGYCQSALAFGTEAIGWYAARFAIGMLGYCYYLLGNNTQSLANMEQELALCQQAESPGSAAGSLWGLGEFYFDLGDYPKAQALLLEALRLLQQGESYHYQVKVMGLLALVYHGLEEPVQARSYGEHAVTLAKTLGDPRLEATASRRLGRVLVSQDEGDLAKKLFHRTLLLHHQMEQNGQALQALAGLAEIALRNKQQQEALNYVEQILEGFATNQLDATDEVLYIYLTCYHILLVNQDLRAQHILQLAYAQLQNRAATLVVEEHRQIFWSVPAHKFVLVAVNQHLPARARLGH